MRSIGWASEHMFPYLLFLQKSTAVQDSLPAQDATASASDGWAAERVRLAPDLQLDGMALEALTPHDREILEHGVMKLLDGMHFDDLSGLELSLIHI